MQTNQEQIAYEDPWHRALEAQAERLAAVQVPEPAPETDTEPAEG